MSDVLQKILVRTREHVRRLKAVKNLAALETEASRMQPPQGFIKAIQNKIKTGDSAFITEMKKSSPSAGILRPDYRPAALAEAYQKAGATCLSVLTDIAYFQGSNEDLIAARNACTLPILRKDFMVDVWQVVEARTIGADCILIIMAAVDDALAADLHACAAQYGLDVLIESHNRAELDRALKLPSGLIGINNRNLKTLKTDLGTTEDLARYVPRDRILVSESGIATPYDIARLRRVDAHAFLIGEALLKQKDVAGSLQALTSA